MARRTDPAKRIVMVGNGMATMASLEAIFKHEVILKKKKEVAITIFGDEPRSNYNRILLSNVLAGITEFEKIVTPQKEWILERGIDLRQGISTTEIDAENKTVTDANGGVTPYDLCLLATGARPIIPAIEGDDKDGVFTFWTIENTERILSAASQHLEAVVIGGGLLGLEAARALINYGVSVTIVQLSDQLMDQQIDPIGAALLKEEIERMGIRVLLETKAEAILGDEAVTGIRISSGETLLCGMVLICAGSHANTTLAKKAGAKINRGVVVDGRMMTSVPGLFATGDLIEHRGLCYGLIAPLKKQAEVLADVMVGKGRKRYEGTVCATTLKVAGISLTSAGELMKGPSGEEISFLDSERGIYKKCVLRQNRLTGFILLGEYEEGLRLFDLLQNGTDISAIKHQLLGKTDVSQEADRPSSVSALSDTYIICNCNHISKREIVESICKRGLKCWEEVADSTEAGTSCGSCVQLIDDLILETNKEKGRLDIATIKREGLGVDFSRITEKGSRAVSLEDEYRLKTYGISPQKHAGYSMLRIRIPGGRTSSKQVVRLARLAEIHGRGRMHLTVRQALELHWFRVEEAETIFEELRGIGLTTRSSCGDTFRNVMACPHGETANDGIFDVQDRATQVSDWVVKSADLMNAAMPNRLNVAFSGCPGCNSTARINDIGFVAVRRKNEVGERETGFELWVGGSIGTDPVLGFKLRSFIEIEDALPACQAIFAIYARYTDRDKKASRLKVLIKKWGQEKFSDRFETVFCKKRGMPENKDFSLSALKTGNGTLGWFKRLMTKLPSQRTSLPSGATTQRQKGRVQLALDIPLGEISAETFKALGEIANRFGDDSLYLTKDQNIELHGIGIRKVAHVHKALKDLGISLKGEHFQPNLISCVGIAFCPLAVTHAQGAARDLLDHYSPDDMAKKQLFQSLSIHISGCQNSCTKHQLADIGLAGAMLPVGDANRNSYQVFLGGTFGRSGADTEKETLRLGERVMKGITEAMVVPLVDALLDIVLAHRHEGERFQQVVMRLGTGKVAALLKLQMDPLIRAPSEEVKMVTKKVEEVLR